MNADPNRSSRGGRRSVALEIAGWAIVGAIFGFAKGWFRYGLDAAAGTAIAGAVVCAAIGALWMTAERVGGGVIGAIAGALIGGFVGFKSDWTIAIESSPPESAVRLGQTLEISGPTLDGAGYRIEDRRGKVVLVDFWATWCAPCVRELPHIKAALERHGDAGFEVVGVSLDFDESKLRGLVERMELSWPQIFFPGRANRLAERYGIETIPATFLLDRDGRVAAIDVRGGALEPAVARLLSGDAAEAGDGTSVERVHITLFPIGFPVGLLAGYTLGVVAERLIRRRRSPPPERPKAAGEPPESSDSPGTPETPPSGE